MPTRTSSTVVQVQVQVGVCEVRTLAGMPGGLVLVLDTASSRLPMRKKMNVEEKT